MATEVDTALVRTGANSGGTLSTLDLDVVVRSNSVVRVWNQGQVSVTTGETSAENNWGPVTNTGTVSTPDTTVLNRDTGVVDVVLSRGLAASPSVVVVGIDNRNRSCGAGLQQGRDVHILGTWVVGSADGDVLLDVGNKGGGLFTPGTQEVGVRVGSVQLTVFTVQAAHGDTVGRLFRWPLGLGHTSLTSVRTVETVLTHLGGVTVLVHDGSETTGQTRDPVDTNNTLASRQGATVMDTILELNSRVNERRKITVLRRRASRGRSGRGGGGLRGRRGRRSRGGRS